jgi:TorA maturation chaperone TorD
MFTEYRQLQNKSNDKETKDQLSSLVSKASFLNQHERAQCYCLYFVGDLKVEE